MTLRPHTLLVLLALSVAGAATAQDIRTTVDRVLVSFPDVQPVMINNRVMVPVRGVFEHLNADVTWDQNTRTVVARRDADRILMTVNSYYGSVNGRQIKLDTPPTIYRGRTMVPLRFLSESLGAGVEWVALSRTVEITTGEQGGVVAETIVARIEPGTVAPFTLNSPLSSNLSKVGDRFSATLVTDGKSDYENLPAGTKLEGRVALATAKKGDTPGVLGLEFDRVVLPNGKGYPIYGVLHGLDNKSVTNVDGKLTAKGTNQKNDLKYVGYGAGAGALISVLTKGNLVTNSIIGAALGYLYGEIKKDPSKSRNVSLEQGTKFGVRLTDDLAFRIPAIGGK